MTRRGFTLIELLAGIAIGGLVLGALAGILLTLGDSGRTVTSAGVAADRRANSDDLLAALIRRSFVRPQDSAYFDGTGQHMAFSSWCDTNLGWQERCRVSVTVLDTGDTLRIVTSVGDTVSRPDSAPAFLRFRAPAGDSLPWIADWGRGPSAPRAIALVRPQDTLIYHVGVAP